MNRNFKWSGRVAMMILIGLLLFPNALAQTTKVQLPDPGLIPGDRLYFLDRLFEQITLLAANGEKKVNLRIEFAEERLAEMIVIDDVEEKQDLVDDYEEELIKAEDEAKFLNRSDLLIHILAQQQKHIAVLEGIKEKFPKTHQINKDIIQRINEDIIQRVINDAVERKGRFEKKFPVEKTIGEKNKSEETPGISFR